jgi:hypothetical protein
MCREARAKKRTCGGHVHTYPYIQHSPAGPHKMPQSCIEYAKEAIEKQAVVSAVCIISQPWARGIICKTSNQLYSNVYVYVGERCEGPIMVMPFKVNRFGMSPDYMHCALLGVSKLLLNLWTDTARCRSTNHNLHADVKILDERIAQITVPSEILHKPREISDMKHWKGWHISFYCLKW